MKKLFNIFWSILLLFSASCTSTKTANKSIDDDIYYSSKDRKTEVSTKAETASTSSADKKNEADRNATNNYYDDSFDYDDYYDYEYAARLRRFHNPAYNYGYYDNYYTNSYWYTNNPSNYGVSIYLGYNFWGPSYDMYTYNPGYFTGCSPWYGSPFYNGFGYGYGYNPYMNVYQHGYHNGYNNGYWNGYYQAMMDNYYVNTFDNNSYFYGHIGSSSTNSPIAHSNGTFGQRYRKAIASEPVKRNEPVKSPMLNSANPQGTTPVTAPSRSSFLAEPEKPVRNIQEPVKEKEFSRPEPERPVFTTPPPVRNTTPVRTEPVPRNERPVRVEPKVEPSREQPAMERPRTQPERTAPAKPAEPNNAPRRPR